MTPSCKPQATTALCRSMPLHPGRSIRPIHPGRSIRADPCGRSVRGLCFLGSGLPRAAACSLFPQVNLFLQLMTSLASKRFTKSRGTSTFLARSLQPCNSKASRSHPTALRVSSASASQELHTRSRWIALRISSGSRSQEKPGQSLTRAPRSEERTHVPPIQESSQPICKSTASRHLSWENLPGGLWTPGLSQTSSAQGLTAGYPTVPYRPHSAGNLLVWAPIWRPSKAPPAAFWQLPGGFLAAFWRLPGGRIPGGCPAALAALPRPSAVWSWLAVDYSFRWRQLELSV